MIPRVKCILPGMKPTEPPDPEHFGIGSDFEWDGVRFIHDAGCREYDWLLVYDDMPRHDVGSIAGEVEPLACPAENTVLVTAEPPTIKLYPRCYTRQFGHVLTTHDACYLPHAHYQRGQGCLRWIADYSIDEVRSEPQFKKTKLISTVCSSKMMKHTQHYNRFRLTSTVAERLPELDWFGWGMKPLPKKYTALSSYKYHLAAENYIHPYHWSDKISDPILGLCLTFYAGDPCLGEILPPESFIPIPINAPEEAVEIITKAIADNEYEKRLPAIREARRLIVSKYNIYSQVATLVHGKSAATPAARGAIIAGRHHLRRSPLNALGELGTLIRFRVLHRTR